MFRLDNDLQPVSEIDAVRLREAMLAHVIRFDASAAASVKLASTATRSPPCERTKPKTMLDCRYRSLPCRRR